MMARFNQIGDKAGSRNRPNVCKVALNAAARHTKNKYGKRTTANSIAMRQRAAWAGSSDHSRSHAASNDRCRPSIASTTITAVVSPSQPITWLTKTKARGRCPAANSSLSVGTIAAVSAPSPNSRRNRFGKVNAVTKAEASALVPNTAVTSMSRPSPSTRDTMVAAETMPMFFRLRDTALFSRSPPLLTSTNPVRETALKRR